MRAELCYGSPRLVKALRHRGIGYGKTRIRRLMKEEGICPKQKAALPATDNAMRSLLTRSPNVLATLSTESAPVQRFHSDITYIPTQEGTHTSENEQSNMILSQNFPITGLKINSLA